MEFIIKEWPDKSATLMTEHGYALSTFNSVGEARSACQAWYAANGYNSHTLEHRSTQDPTFPTCTIR